MQASDGSSNRVAEGAGDASGPGGGVWGLGTVERLGGAGGLRDQCLTENPLGGSGQEEAAQPTGGGDQSTDEDAGEDSDSEDHQLIQAKKRDRAEHPDRYQALYKGDRARLARFMFTPRLPESILITCA